MAQLNVRWVGHFVLANLVRLAHRNAIFTQIRNASERESEQAPRNLDNRR